MEAETGTGLESAPGLCTGVFVPYFVSFPYSKYHVVDRPLGLTVPFSVADVDVTLLAAPVTTAGAAEVVKIASAP
jgi:hypothetical protein